MPEERNGTGPGAIGGADAVTPAPSAAARAAAAVRSEPGTVLVVPARPPLDDPLSVAVAELRRPAVILEQQVRRLRRSPETAAAIPARVLEALEDQVSRLGAISGMLAELDAIEHGRVQLRKRYTVAGALLDRVAAAVPARPGATLSVVPSEEPLELLADSALVESALETLLQAFTASATPGSRVQLAADPAHGGVCISIELVPTARSGQRRDRREPLPRLELALARRLAELHGGSLDVEEADAVLRARMTLPLASESLPKRAPSAQGTRPRLLVVDDDEDARETLGMMLGDDYEVVLAADGLEALEKARAGRLAAVLMDLYMPHMDGLAALEHMRASAATADIPVILISARGDELTRSRSLDLGAVDFLQKPFSARELKARIERTLRLMRRETELQELAQTDPLTGLANVRSFRSRLQEEIKRARRYHTPLACVMVDMDHLKAINDELGHVAGDLAIRAMADVIRRELRETDFGARYGGDEFVLLLPHTTCAEARVFAERVAHKLESSPIELRGREISLGASFGIAALGTEPADESGEDLVHRADAALYDAKRAGRGRVVAQIPTAEDLASPS